MAQKRSVTVAALNIRTHPKHSPEQYKQLIIDAFKLKRRVKVRGDQHMVINYLDQSTSSDADGELLGTIARFTNIDENLPWFDEETLDEASDDLVEQINIPSNLKPNYVPFNFLFLPKKHLLLFETYGSGNRISPRVVEKFAKILFSEKSLKKKHDEITIDLVSDSEKVEQMLKLHKLKHVEITVRKPNPDDLAGLDQKIQDRLLREKAKSVKEVIDAVDGDSLEPSEDTENLAKVASLNGSVYVEGYNADGVKVEESTSEHPKTETEKFDPDLMPDHTAFKRVALVLAAKVSALLRN